MNNPKPRDETCESCCPPKPDLVRRPLLGTAESARLSRIFKVMANDSRLRLLHALAKHRELSVFKLADLLGMKPQAVSNQLQKLTAGGFLGCRRDGTKIHYRIVDPCIQELLDRGLCLAEDARTRTTRVRFARR